MIQHEDVIDRKLIALIGRSKTAITHMAQSGVKADYFNSMYQPLVDEIFEYYKNFFELLTPDILTQILVDKNFEIQTITAIVATFEDIVNDPELVDDPADTSELEYFLDRIKKRKALKTCEDALRDIANSVVNGKIDSARSAMAKTIISVDEISRKEEISEGSLGVFADKRLKRYEDRKLHPEWFKGIQSGFPDLDEVTDGFQPGDLILYVAESGGGKSVNLLHSAYQAWIEKYPGAGVGANVVLFSLEMDWAQYLRRFDSMHSKLDSYKLKSSTLEGGEYDLWVKNLELQKNKQNLFYLVDMPSGCTTLYIRNKLEEIRMKFPDKPIDLIVIDYLGIMQPSQEVDGQDWLRQGIISLECKQLARQERVPVLTAVQETRDSIKDAKAQNKNTAILGRSHMIGTNANIIMYSKLHQMDEADDDLKIFKTYNDNPNVIHYQVIKSRDSKKVSFSCGADFSKMLIQPVRIGKDDAKALSDMAVNNKTEQKPKMKDPEDAEEFVKFYERTRNQFPNEHQLSAA